MCILLKSQRTGKKYVMAEHCVIAPSLVFRLVTERAGLKGQTQMRDWRNDV